MAPHVPAAIFVLGLFCIGHLGNISLLLIEKHHLELFFIGEWQRSLSSSLQDTSASKEVQAVLAIFDT